jgi:hypothetical protein
MQLQLEPALEATPRLTAAEFEGLCKLLWAAEPDGWQNSAAAFLKVSVRSIQYFGAEPPAKTKPVPPAVRGELFAEVARRAADTAVRAAMEARTERHAAQLRVMRAALA